MKIYQHLKNWPAIRSLARRALRSFNEGGAKYGAPGPTSLFELRRTQQDSNLRPADFGPFPVTLQWAP